MPRADPKDTLKLLQKNRGGFYPGEVMVPGHVWFDLLSSPLLSLSQQSSPKIPGDVTWIWHLPPQKLFVGRFQGLVMLNCSY